MDYDTLRHFADSWGLLYLLVIFLIAVGAALRPGARSTYAEAARIPLRED
jgi:cytochrome c oxidase cbb3-type subunit 4